MNQDELYLFLALHYNIQPIPYCGGLYVYLNAKESLAVGMALLKFRGYYSTSNSAAWIIGQQNLLNDF